MAPLPLQAAAGQHGGPLIPLRRGERSGREIALSSTMPSSSPRELFTPPNPSSSVPAVHSLYASIMQKDVIIGDLIVVIVLDKNGALPAGLFRKKKKKKRTPVIATQRLMYETQQGRYSPWKHRNEETTFAAICNVRIWHILLQKAFHAQLPRTTKPSLWMRT